MPINPTREPAADFVERVRTRQQGLVYNLQRQYDFIICGAGSSGSVVAARLAENPEVSVLLVEAGGTDDVPEVIEGSRWLSNVGSERDWGFASAPEKQLNGRSMPLSMGKVLGGGSSINVMTWARGHSSDWDHFAAETGDPAWGYASVLKLYQRIEDWHGQPDPTRRGIGGPIFVQPPEESSPLALSTLEAARSTGIPVFDSQNGCMMEGAGGAALMDLTMQNGRRRSVFRAYAYPLMDRPNLTVLTSTLVTRLTFSGSTVTGVEVVRDGKQERITAGCEVVLSLGAIQTPRLLMQSGVGDREQLRRFGIPVVQHLPGVGRNLQDHVNFNCIWECERPLPPSNNRGGAVIYWKSDPSLEAPDLIHSQAEFPAPTPETATVGVPEHAWSMLAGVVRPHSRGSVSLTGSDADSPLHIETGALSHPADIKAALATVELCREICNGQALRSLTRREVLPGKLDKPETLNFLRNAAATFWHQTCTAKMGRDAMSVVNGNLAVYGINNLRIADGSVMPRITTGNTSAPCVVIGERAADLLRGSYRL